MNAPITFRFGLQLTNHKEAGSENDQTRKLRGNWSNVSNELVGYIRNTSIATIVK
jgi:hypothetical protein